MHVVESVSQAASLEMGLVREMGARRAGGQAGRPGWLWVSHWLSFANRGGAQGFGLVAGPGGSVCLRAACPGSTLFPAASPADP